MNSKIAVGCVIAAIIAFIAYAGWPRHDVMHVVSLDWKRSIAIEELGTVKEYGERSVPSGARVFDSDLRRSCTSNYSSINGKHTYVGETCRYYTTYDYEIERFVESRWVHSGGQFGSTPRWPDFILAGPNGQPHGVGVERKGVMREDYSITAKNDARGTVEWSTNFSTWRTFEPHQIVDATFMFGRVTNLTHLESN